jgi:hypothetical protein
MNTIRQGDVLLIPVNALPEDLLEMAYEGRAVVMEGEATGHAHAFYDGGVKLYKAPKAARPSYLRVVETEAFLRHEEHETATIPPGIYQIPQQSEYTPEELRRVTD